MAHTEVPALRKHVSETADRGRVRAQAKLAHALFQFVESVAASLLNQVRPAPVPLHQQSDAAAVRSNPKGPFLQAKRYCPPPLLPVLRHTCTKRWMLHRCMPRRAFNPTPGPQALHTAPLGPLLTTNCP